MDVKSFKGACHKVDVARKLSPTACNPLARAWFGVAKRFAEAVFSGLAAWEFCEIVVHKFSYVLCYDAGLVFMLYNINIVKTQAKLLPLF